LCVLSIDIAVLKFNNLVNTDILEINQNEFNNTTVNNIKKITDILTSEKYFSEWLYIVPELDENGYEHYHCITAIKTLVNYNAHVKTNMINDLRTSISLDININVLYNFEKISKKLNYILKQSYLEYEKYDYISKKIINMQNLLLTKGLIPNQQNTL
jgi:hypothetical protein